MRHLYNSKITIQSVTRIKDIHGSMTESWADVSGLTDIPCRINWSTLVGRGEHVINNQLQWTRDASIYLAYYSDLTVEMRVVYDGKNYDIVNLANIDERGQYMKLSIKRVKD
jgi:SPP1 family predicted phage head-tail adaptor